MTSQQTPYILNINIAGKVIGTLTLDKATNQLKLEYNQAWQKEGFAISPHLPLNNIHQSTAAYNFLENSLPEGEARKRLADNLGVSIKNIYPQIRALGKDLAGAVTFTLYENDTSTAAKPLFRHLTQTELEARLDTKDQLGLLTWDNKPRLSVAGVQDKINVLINQQNQIGFGDGSLCSTHILKFEKQNYPNLVLNEYLCMKLSSAVGLPTAKVELTSFGKHPALIVHRFDRKYQPNQQRVLRRHVIDGCQALNLATDSKYERNLGDGRDVKHIRDGASLEKLCQFCQSMSSPAQSTQWLINWQLFNLMISNYDSHAKNVSLFFSKNSSEFTPAYDLVNIAMFPQFQHQLAMAIGDEFDPSNINAYQLADFAETCHISKKLLTRLLTQLADKVINTITNNDFINELSQSNDLSKEQLTYLDKLTDNILAKTRHLQAQADLIVNIEM